MSLPLWKFEQVMLRGSRGPRLHIPELEMFAGVTGVLGPSGAGKTSLLNLLSGFEQPHQGSLTANLPAHDGQLPLFWVPQSDGLWPHLTVREHLQVVIADGRRSGARNDELLALFELTDRADARPDTLSLGEKARLSVSRALASGAAVLVMDEPLAHVDEARTPRLRDCIRRHCAENGTSLVFASHRPETMLAMAQRVVCLEHGDIVYDGNVEELYYSPPTPKLAGFLGPANWFSDDDAARWFGNGTTPQPCCRPEQLTVTKCEDSQIVVEASRFAGAVSEVDLVDKQSDCRRTFVHRPARNQLRPGDHVTLKLMLALLIVSMLPGCGNDGGAGPRLPVTSTAHWPMPPDGQKIPAPRGMTCGPNNEVYVVDNAGRVLVFDEAGKLLRQWNMPESDVGNPEGVCVFRDGRVAVADTHYSRVVFFSQQGDLLGMSGQQGKGPGEFIYPVAITQDDHENFYVGEYGSNDRVQKFSVDGKYLLEFGTCGLGEGQFQRASGIVWHDGKVYVADAFNNRIQVFTDAGEFLSVLGSKEGRGSKVHELMLEFPYDLCRGIDGDLYVVEYQAGRVSRMSLSGELLGRFGSTGTAEDQFYTPWGLAVNSHGRVYVADTNNRRIVELKM